MCKQIKKKVIDYSNRKSAKKEDIERWLGPNLAYSS